MPIKARLFIGVLVERFEQVRRAGRLPRKTTPRPPADFPADESEDADVADELSRVESR